MSEEPTDVKTGDALLAKAGVKRGDLFVRVFEKYDSRKTYVLTRHKLLSWEPGTGIWVDVRVTDENGKNECSLGSGHIYPVTPEVQKILDDIEETQATVEELQDELKKLVKKLEGQPSLHSRLDKAARDALTLNTQK